MTFFLIIHQQWPAIIAHLPEGESKQEISFHYVSIGQLVWYLRKHDTFSYIYLRFFQLFIQNFLLTFVLKKPSKKKQKKYGEKHFIKTEIISTGHCACVSALQLCFISHIIFCPRFALLKLTSSFAAETITTTPSSSLINNNASVVWQNINRQLILFHIVVVFVFVVRFPCKYKLKCQSICIQYMHSML